MLYNFSLISLCNIYLFWYFLLVYSLFYWFSLAVCTGFPVALWVYLRPLMLSLCLVSLMCVSSETISVHFSCKEGIDSCLFSPHSFCYKLSILNIIMWKLKMVLFFFLKFYFYWSWVVVVCMVSFLNYFIKYSLSCVVSGFTLALACGQLVFLQRFPWAAKAKNRKGDRKTLLILTYLLWIGASLPCLTGTFVTA